MRKIFVALTLSAALPMAFADSSINTAYGDGVNTVYSSNPALNTPLESGFKPLFKSGWYGHPRDVTYMKIAQIESNLGVTILYSNNGYFCPVNQYLLFKYNPNQANSYNYQMDKECTATITVDTKKNTLIMTVNSRTACFEEPVYTEFCNGNENVHITDEPASNLFINQIFTYQKDQNDSSYHWNANQ